MKLPATLFLAVTLLSTAAGCESYMKVMSALPVTGSVQAINTMSVPVCKVTLYSTSDPGSVYDNTKNASVLIAPGETKSLSYPIAKDEKGGPKSDMKYGMRVYGCKKQAYDMDPGGQLADVKDVDVKQQLVLR